jgi:hypothetical protein
VQAIPSYLDSKMELSSSAAELKNHGVQPTSRAANRTLQQGESAPLHCVAGGTPLSQVPSQSCIVTNAKRVEGCFLTALACSLTLPVH